MLIFIEIFAFLKWAGLESSGRIVSSWYWKTKRIAFFLKFFFSYNFFFFKVNLRFFWIFLTIWQFFSRFLGFIMDFWIFKKNFEFFLDVLFFLFLFFFFFSGFLGFLSKLQRLLLKVTKVTTGHPKLGQNSLISSLFLPGLGLGQSPPQELEVGQRSGPYLLVFVNLEGVAPLIPDPPTMKLHQQAKFSHPAKPP